MWCFYNDTISLCLFRVKIPLKEEILQRQISLRPPSGRNRPDHRHQEHCDDTARKSIVIEVHAPIHDPDIERHRRVQKPANTPHKIQTLRRSAPASWKRAAPGYADGFVISHARTVLAMQTPAMIGKIFRKCFPVALNPTMVKIPPIVGPFRFHRLPAQRRSQTDH